MLPSRENTLRLFTEEYIDIFEEFLFYIASPTSTTGPSYLAFQSTCYDEFTSDTGAIPLNVTATRSSLASSASRSRLF